MRSSGESLAVSIGERGVEAAEDGEMERREGRVDATLAGFAELLTRVERFFTATAMACRVGSAGLPLGKELLVGATAFVSAEAMVEGHAEPVEAEVPGAARIGAVEEWTMDDTVGHGCPFALAPGCLVTAGSDR